MQGTQHIRQLTKANSQVSCRKTTGKLGDLWENQENSEERTWLEQVRNLLEARR